MTKVSDERALWLGRYVLPHEPALRAWLSTRRLAGLDVDDVIQEAFTRLIVAREVGHIRNHRTYLFQTAKSVIASHVRRARIVQILTISDLGLFDAAADEPTAEDYVSDREQLRNLAEAIAALPEPTRTIFRLRRVEQTSQRDISKRLGMPESTVEKHISRALRFMVERIGRGGNDASVTSKASMGTGLNRDAKANRPRN